MASIYKRKNLNRDTYYAHFSIRGERYRVKLDAQNKEQAKKMAAEVEYQVLQGNYKFLDKFNSMTLKQLSEKYIEYAKSTKRSWIRDVVSLKNILNMQIDNKYLGDYPIDQIKVTHIQKYQTRRKRELDAKYENKGILENERSFATVNRELACLKHIFFLAIEWELVAKNPVVSKAIKFDKERSRKRTLSDAEFISLLKSCNGYLYQIVVVAVNTGMRLGEILGLKWDNVNLEDRKIFITHTKTDLDREVPINNFLFAELSKMSNRTGYLFTNRNNEKLGTIKTTWKTTLENAGIEKFRFHDLRHTAATRLAKAKVTESVIAMILGHARDSITSRYINPQWEEMVEAVEALGSLCHKFVTSELVDDGGDACKNNINNKIGQAG